MRPAEARGAHDLPTGRVGPEFIKPYSLAKVPSTVVSSRKTHVRECRMKSPALPAWRPESNRWVNHASMGNYSQACCRQTPGLIILLVDQSKHASTVRCEISLAVNQHLNNLVIGCSHVDGVRDWLHIAAIGYRSDEYGRAIVQPALIGPLAGQEVISISDIGSHPGRIDESTAIMWDDESAGMVELPQRVPVWIDPVAAGEAPLCAAIAEACRIVDDWISRFPHSFPPVVWNITAGVFSDGNPWPYADALKRRGTDDGRVLLLHTYLPPHATSDAFIFPVEGEKLPDAAATALYATASVLPPTLHQQLRARGDDVRPSARCLSYRCDSFRFWGDILENSRGPIRY